MTQLSIFDCEPIPEIQAQPVLPTNVALAEPIALFKIGDRVQSETSFKRFVGIIVDVDSVKRRARVHFGVQNHPSPCSWDDLTLTDKPVHLWPSPEPQPICWVEWKRGDRAWLYTGTMGLEIRTRHPNTELFPAGIDPNVCGVAL